MTQVISRDDARRAIALLENIGPLLRRTRQQRNISLQRLADELSISHMTLSSIERGLTNTNVAYAARILRWIADGT